MNLWTEVTKGLRLLTEYTSAEGKEAGLKRNVSSLANICSFLVDNYQRFKRNHTFYTGELHEWLFWGVMRVQHTRAYIK